MQFHEPVGWPTGREATPSSRCAWRAAVQDGGTEFVCLLELPSGSSVGKGNSLCWWVGEKPGGLLLRVLCVPMRVSDISHPLSSGTRGVPGPCCKRLPWHFIFIDLPSLSCPFPMHGGGFHLTFLCNVPFTVIAGQGAGAASVTLFSCVCRSAEGSGPVPSCSSRAL